MRRENNLHDICVLTYTLTYDGSPPTYHAYIGGVFRDKANAWLMAGRLSWLSDVRSIEIWTMVGGEKHRQILSWQRPSLDEWWATDEGEWEAAYAHEIELCRCLKYEGLPLADYVYKFAREKLLWDSDELDRWGMSCTTRDSNAKPAENGPSEEGPGTLIV